MRQRNAAVCRIWQYLDAWLCVSLAPCLACLQYFVALTKLRRHVAGLKAYTTHYTNNAISACRECCGGHGYAAVNRLGALRSDHDIFQTFEGDNTVLMQQVSGYHDCSQFESNFNRFTHY